MDKETREIRRQLAENREELADTIQALMKKAELRRRIKESLASLTSEAWSRLLATTGQLVWRARHNLRALSPGRAESAPAFVGSRAAALAIARQIAAKVSR